MDKSKLEQLHRELEQKVHLANEQIRKAQEEYARNVEVERNRDIDEAI